MPHPEIKELDQLTGAHLSALVARGAHLLQERGIPLDALGTTADSRGEAPLELINPLINPADLPPAAFGDGRILLKHDEYDRVMVDGEVRRLSCLQFDILSLWAINRGRVVPHEFTLKTIWPEFSPESYRRTGTRPSTKISVVLSQINKVLGVEDLGHSQKGAIRGVRGIGHVALITRDIRPEGA